MNNNNNNNTNNNSNNNNNNNNNNKNSFLYLIQKLQRNLIPVNYRNHAILQN